MLQTCTRSNVAIYKFQNSRFRVKNKNKKINQFYLISILHHILHHIVSHRGRERRRG